MAIQSSQGATGTTPESTAKTGPDNRLPLDVVYGILSNERRRRTLRYLLDDDGAGGTTLSTLAEHIASIENEKPIESLTSAERKRVYICLYQCHLPKLDDAGVIDFDNDRKTIELAENAEHIATYLPAESQSTDGQPDALTRVAGLIPGGLQFFK